MSILIHDIETLRTDIEVEGGWDNKAGMGFGTGVIYNYDNDCYYFFMPHEREIYCEFLQNNIVVSFNGKAFDNLVALDENEPEVIPWVDIDLFELIIRSKYNVSDIDEAFRRFGQNTVLDGFHNLDAICKGTLGIGKSGKGIKAPSMIKSQQWGSVFSYNLQDVRRTKQLFEFIGENKFCINGKGDRIEIPNFGI